jgi:hypothetical protein
MKPGGAWWMVAGCGLLTACVVPPDGQSIVFGAGQTPFIDLNLLRPDTPKFNVDPRTCNEFRIEANSVADPDSTRLRFRWVTNNRLNGVKWIEDRVVERTLGSTFDSFTRVFPSSDFPALDLNFLPATGVVSALITDADAWADPEPDNRNPEARNLGELPDGSDGSVVEARWTIEFLSTGECPQ